MALRDLLPLITEDPAAVALGREGGHAFASASLRPYLIAALAEIDPQTAAGSSVIRGRRSRRAIGVRSTIELPWPPARHGASC